MINLSCLLLNKGTWLRMHTTHTYTHMLTLTPLQSSRLVSLKLISYPTHFSCTPSHKTTNCQSPNPYLTIHTNTLKPTIFAIPLPHILHPSTPTDSPHSHPISTLIPYLPLNNLSITPSANSFTLFPCIPVMLTHSYSYMCTHMHTHTHTCTHTQRVV